MSLFDIVYTKNTDGLDCDKIKANVCDSTALGRAIRGKDVIVHLAAVSRVEWGQQDPQRCLRVNALGMLTLLEAVRRNNSDVTIIMGSSREVYGEPAFTPVTEGHPKNPISVYGVSKLAAENLLLTFDRVYGLDYVILRFSNVYGSPRDLPERVIPKFMRQAMENKPLTVYGGRQILDFTFIDDVIEGIVNAVTKAINLDENVINNYFNFATGKGTSIMELAALIKEVCDSSSEIVIKKARNFDVSKFIGHCQKSEQYLSYKPIHQVKEGLKIYKQRLLADEGK